MTELFVIKNRLFLSALIILSILIVSYEAFNDLIYMWSNRKFYQYGWLIIPTCIILLFYNRYQFTKLNFTYSYIGCLLFIAAMFLGTFSQSYDFNFGGQIFFVFSIIFGVLFVFGFTMFKKLIPYFLLLILMVPLGDLLLDPLKLALKYSVEFLALITNIPFEESGYNFSFNNYGYQIIDYCSGMDKFLIGIFLGLVYSITLNLNFKQTLKCIILGGVLGLLSNILRVYFILITDYFRAVPMIVEEHRVYEDYSVYVLLFGLTSYFVIKNYVVIKK